jgi:anti-anti-sigma factor
MPTHLSTRAEARDGIAILRVAGEVDLATALPLAQAIERELSPGGALIADLTGVEFIDSAGTRALALADRAATALGCRLLIVPSEAVSHVFEMAALESVLTLCAREDEALDAARSLPHLEPGPTEVR